MSDAPVVREWHQHSAYCFILAARTIIRPVANEISRHANISSIHPDKRNNLFLNEPRAMDI